MGDIEELEMGEKEGKGRGYRQRQRGELEGRDRVETRV
jgi:hypothetical protein